MQKVVAVVQDGAEPFGLGSICEVWAEPYHPEDDNPVFDFVVCTETPGVVRGRAGFDLVVDHDLRAIDDADLVCIVPKSDYLDQSPAVVDAVRRAHERGAWIFAHCSGAFVLGEAGLLDGRRCTTHWRFSERLAQRYPLAQVDPDVLYVQDGTIVTGAGSAAGIDAALHVMRQHFGSKVAATTARRIVVPPHRDGGQAQYVRTPIRTVEAETLSPLLDWATEHLAESLTVERLAARANLSPRTFARRFRDETGTTPLQWLTAQRVALAEQLLEDSVLSVEQIAHRVGFGNAATLRHHFTTSRGTTPTAYRRTFTCVDAC